MTGMRGEDSRNQSYAVDIILGAEDYILTKDSQMKTK